MAATTCLRASLADSAAALSCSRPLLPCTASPKGPQAGIDEPGGPADLGEHLVAHLRRGTGAVGVLAHGPELHPPQAEERVGGDLRLGVVLAVCWCVPLIAVCVPLALRRFRTLTA